MTLKQIQTLIYRGEIKSCNYRCGYCPFHKQDRNDKQQDEAALWRMVEHLPALGSPLNVLITPYGEALRYRYYMAAMAKISRYSHVQAVGIQTNASFNLSSLIATMQDNQGIWQSCGYGVRFILPRLVKMFSLNKYWQLRTRGLLVLWGPLPA